MRSGLGRYFCFILFVMENPSLLVLLVFGLGQNERRETGLSSIDKHVSDRAAVVMGRVYVCVWMCVGVCGWVGV